MIILGELRLAPRHIMREHSRHLAGGCFLLRALVIICNTPCVIILRATHARARYVALEPIQR